MRRGDRCLGVVKASFARNAIGLIAVKTRWAQFKRDASVVLSAVRSVVNAYWALRERRKDALMSWHRRKNS